MKNNLWVKFFFGFFACISAAGAANTEEDKARLQSNWPAVWKRGNFYYDPNDGSKWIGQSAAVNLGKQKILDLFPNHTSAELQSLKNAIFNHNDFYGIGAISSVDEAIEHRKKQEWAYRRHPEHNPETPRPSQTVSSESNAENVNSIGKKQGIQPQEQDIQPQEQGIQPQEQGIQPQEQGIQPRIIQTKKKLFGNLIKDKHHHHIIRKSQTFDGGYTDVTTPLLTQMLEKLGFDTSDLLESSRDDLIKNLINQYNLVDIESALNNLNNAGYTQYDDGCEAVSAVQDILADTVKMYNKNPDKESNRFKKKDQSKSMNQGITEQHLNNPTLPQDLDDTQGVVLQVKTASEAFELRKNILKKIDLKEKRLWNKIMENTAKNQGVPVKSVRDAYSILMNSKAKDEAIQKLSDDAVNVLIKSQVLFSLSNPVKVNLKEVAKNKKAGRKEAEKLADIFEKKMTVVKNGLDYGVEITPETTYAIMSMFGLGETRQDREIKQQTAESVDHEQLNEYRQENSSDFTETYMTMIKDAVDEINKGFQGNQKQRAKFITNILDAVDGEMQSAPAA
jgi:hypothetical protein